jgi:hypothetical protein
MGIVNKKERKMASIIPAKDVAGLILKDIQDFVRKEFPNATAEERRELEWKFAFGSLGGLFNSPMN